MAKMSVHELLNSMSPWGTIGDQELIDMAKEEDEDADVQPIWRGFTVEGKTPVDMVNAFTERLAKIFELLRTEGNEGLGKEENMYMRKGMDEGLPFKVAHALSMAIDDEIEGEVGFEAQAPEQEMETHFHK